MWYTESLSKDLQLRSMEYYHNSSLLSIILFLGRKSVLYNIKQPGTHNNGYHWFTKKTSETAEECLYVIPL